VLEPAGGVGPTDEIHRPADRLVESVLSPGAELLEDRLQLAPAELFASSTNLRRSSWIRGSAYSVAFRLLFVA
jgi:hypothetical protein